jgi:4-amino-4-deoxy-L-arabinose transferase-like glycosyltransferase
MTRPRAGLLLAAILVAALVLRLGYGSRIIDEDALGYHGAATHLRSGEPMPVDLANLRYAFVAPIAVAQALFGESLGAARLVPLAYSLGGIALVYALGLVYGGLPVALGAAALLAIVPLDVVQATDLHADLTLAFWMAAVVYAVKRGEIASAGRARWFVLGGLALGAAYLTKEIAVVLVPLLGLRLLWLRRRPTGYGWLVGALLLVLAVDVAWLRWLTGDGLYRLSPLNAAAHERMMLGWQTSRFWMLDFPFMLLYPFGTSFGYFVGLGWIGLAGGAYAIVRRDRVVGELSLWWLGLVAVFSALPLDATFSRPLFPHLARTLHPIVIPLCLAAAAWCSRGLDGARWIRGGVIVGVVILAGLGTWAIDEDNRFWNEVIHQALPVIDRYPDDTLVAADAFSTLVLRFLRPGRADRIVEFGRAGLDTPSGEILVLRDPPFVRQAIAHGPPVPNAVRVPPLHWQRVAHFSRSSRPSVRGRALGLLGISRESPPGDALSEPATLWLIRPGSPSR